LESASNYFFSEKFESRHLDSHEEILATMANVPPLARAVLVLMGFNMKLTHAL
jgi:hypothetical protein